jgi:TRAP transporter TAXI family solute receptor
MEELVRKSLFAVLLMVLFILGPLQIPELAQAPSTSSVTMQPVDVGATGIAIKRPVFAGACKACPWGVLAYATAAALKPYGYDVVICFVCWSNFGPREMADRTKPVIPPGELDPVTTEPPPNAVPDISATSEVNLIAAWNGTGPYAKDGKPRHNYRVIAAVQQPNYLLTAVSKKSGITDLSQIKDRPGPTWITVGNEDAATSEVLQFYGITEEALKSRGGGLIHSTDRNKRASADAFIGNGLLVNTPEQRLWYEVSQLNDLVFLPMDSRLVAQLAQQPGYTLATIPLALLRGVDKTIPTVARTTHFIYVRDDAPDSFAYAVAKALDEHQEQFRMYGDPFFYDTRLVAVSKVIPMHPGALKYYRQRGYIKK